MEAVARPESVDELERAPHPAAARGSGSLGYLPGLDGLRAASVLLVLAYHYRPDRSLLSGGFLGVEVFFVISGYLITALLLDERRKHGSISLRNFWMRRVRRLFPALYSMLILVGLLVAVFYREGLGRLRGGLFSGALYFSNWQQISSGVLYADTDHRSPLGHLWSLAVEEQFYLLWPLLFAAGMFFFRQRFKWVILGAAIASWTWMAYLVSNRPVFQREVLANAELKELSNWFNRIYLATDTRAAGLLIGAFLAYFWVPRKLRGVTGRNAARLLDGAAIVAGIILLALIVTATLQSVWLYWWGFVLVDVCTVVLIAATVHPVSHVGRLLGIKPLRYIGVRSYGIYLWGIAVFEFTRPGFDVHFSGPMLLLLRLMLVAVVAEASYRLVERPVRSGAISRLWRHMRSSDGKQHDQLVLLWQVVGITMVLVVGSLSVAAYASQPPVEAKAIECQGDDIILNPAKCAKPPAFRPIATTTTKPGKVKPGETPRTTPPVVDSSGWVFTAVGDSVMLGAQNTLTKKLTDAGGPANVNAEVGRQGQLCLEVLRALRDAKQLGPIVIVHCGDNGFIAENFVQQVVEITGPTRHVVMMTVKVPRQWEGPNNVRIMEGAKAFANVKVLDWHFHAIAKPPEYFAKSDTYHLTKIGAEFYVNLIHDFLRDQNWL